MWHATQSYFIGEWQMVRIVEDVGHGVIGEVWGEAVFTPQGADLACVEKGVMRFAGEDSLTERTALWRFGEDGRIEVRHADGRPFHDILTDAPIALTVEGNAQYRIEYDFDLDTWMSTWEMSVPGKAYRMTTRYRRPGTAGVSPLDLEDDRLPFDPLVDG